jgi:hypothetical protein
VKAMVHYHLRWVDEHSVWARYLFQMRHAEFMKSTEVVIAGQNQAFAHRIFQWLNARIEAGELKRLPLDLYIPLILGPCQEFARLWLAGVIHTELASAAKLVAETIWQGLKISRKE